MYYMWQVHCYFLTVASSSLYMHGPLIPYAFMQYGTN